MIRYWCLLCKAQDPAQTHPLIHSQNHKIAQLFGTQHVQVQQQRLTGGRTGSWPKIAENRIDQEVWEAGRVVDQPVSKFSNKIIGRIWQNWATAPASEMGSVSQSSHMVLQGRSLVVQCIYHSVVHVIGALLQCTIILVLYGSHMVLQGRSMVHLLSII